MTESKYGKYICSTLKEEVKLQEAANPPGQRIMDHIIWMDDEVIPGAYYSEVVWFWPTSEKDDSSPEPHTHEYDEEIGFFGTDPKDLNNLGAEIEFYIDDERNLMRESFLAFIPAGISIIIPSLMYF